MWEIFLRVGALGRLTAVVRDEREYATSAGDYTCLRVLVVTYYFVGTGVIGNTAFCGFMWAYVIDVLEGEFICVLKCSPEIFGVAAYLYTA